jgi:hypothetical protein
MLLQTGANSLIFPAANQEKPTPRAISERLVKLRSLVKKNGGGEGHFAISVKSTASPKTPRTPKAPGSGSVRKNRATETGSASARKKVGGAIKIEDEVMESTEVPEGGIKVKTETKDKGQNTSPIPLVAASKSFPSSLPTPSETEGAALSSMDGAIDTPTPTPSRRMVTRGKRLPFYASSNSGSEDNSDISDFRGSPNSGYGGDDDDGI